jgi:hypothetical protein
VALVSSSVNLLYVLPGVLAAAAGVIALLVLLGSVGALAKSEQLSAIGTLASGRAGSKKRMILSIALAAIVVGTCSSFAGVAASDAAREAACGKSCAAKGYSKGEIGPSVAHDPTNPKRAAFVACTCRGGPAPDPLETRADSLEP